ncbi:hypothetical protein [Ornithinimicrobium sp. W1665]|uniref:hypothetical protein n=1 Tax=Ornithinimicrobium sp. W1665 TaxID=3416666 RepID=UPI003CE98611
MSAADLSAYVNSTATADEPFVAACWAEAEELVAAYVGLNVVPAVTLHRATLEVAAELFHRRNAPGGITQFAALDGPSPVRMARDPMLGAYPILDRFLPAGLA